MHVLGRIGAATAAAMMIGGAAQAVTLDFTTLSTFDMRSSAQASGAAGAGNAFTVTGSGGKLTYNVSTGPGAVGGLAGETDGLGIRDDEVGAGEYITVTFDKAVRLTSASFLDMFFAPQAVDQESAWVYAGTPPEASGTIAAVDASELFRPGGAGFQSVSFSAIGRVFSFDAGDGNDDQGIGDFALAGLTFEDIAPVPLPAGGVLLGTALLGFGLARRRKA